MRERRYRRLEAAIGGEFQLAAWSYSLRLDAAPPEVVDAVLDTARDTILDRLRAELRPAPWWRRLLRWLQFWRGPKACHPVPCPPVQEVEVTIDG